MINYEKWLLHANEAEKEMLLTMSSKEIQDSFRCDLEFGTGGLRGIIGPGTNRINKYVIARASYGVSQYILKHCSAEKSVVIAYDSRHFSEEFARISAGVFSSAGIKVYIFSSLRPTPELSFAVRFYKASAGIMITASHNPAKYNGYKVYGSDGGQITPQTANEILSEIRNTAMFEVNTTANARFIHTINHEVDAAYINAVCSQSVRETVKDSLTIVYTPLYGSGCIPLKTALEQTGFKNVLIVKEQENPNGDFPKLTAPNPEEADSFILAKDLAYKNKADLILATDCDGDRLGAAALKDDEYTLLTGNQIGILLTDYILSSKDYSDGGAIVSTIVSTRMTEKIAKHYNVKCFKTLTGFKYIGEKISEFQKNVKYRFIFGFEESYGFLSGDYCRDKDAVLAGMLTAEMAAYYKNKGMTLFDALESLYKKFGGYYEELQSITYDGTDGAKKISSIMSLLRNTQPKKIADEDIISITDYTKPTNLPISDVLYFRLKNGVDFVIRPSGTEPKIKIYYLSEGITYEDAMKKAKYVKKLVSENILS